MTRIRDLIRQGEEMLVSHGVPNARRNAEWILCDTLGCSMLDLYLESSRPSQRQVDVFHERIARRAAREPLQYILGTTEFMALPFEVYPGVFVPRPDTEVLVEEAERWLRRRPLGEPLRVLDLCCGSGVIGVALAQRIPNLVVDAVDRSPDAVDATGRNARINGVDARVRVHHADAVEFLEGAVAGGFAAVACNPPYIETAVIASLPPEVALHEPVAALDGGADGLDVYRALIPRLSACLVPRGLTIFEIGDAQASAVSGMLERERFTDIHVTQDLSGHDRVVAAISPADTAG
jgi:release factor glutamine methyltransferase